MEIHILSDFADDRRNLEKMIQNSILKHKLEMRIGVSCCDATEFLKCTKGLKRGIYFIFVYLYLSDMNGIEVGRRIRERNHEKRDFINYVTSFLESAFYMIRYKMPEFRFFLKDKNLECRIEQYLYDLNKKLMRKDLIFAYLQIPYKDIIYIKVSDKRKVNIISTNGLYCFNSYLKDLLKLLDDRFLCISQSEIINTDYILNVDTEKRQVILEGHGTHDISVRRLENFLKKWEKA